MTDRLAEFLARREKQRVNDPTRVPAAVLVPVYLKDGQHHVLFTKRTELVSTHKGQVSFPGGTFDPGDKTLLDTALRESAEEIGLLPRDARILGELDDEVSLTSNYIITPFVGEIPWPYDFKLNVIETERLIEAPVSALLGNGCVRRELQLRNGEPMTAFYYTCQRDLIWGATARILNQFLDIYSQASR